MRGIILFMRAHYVLIKDVLLTPSVLEEILFDILSSHRLVLCQHSIRLSYNILRRKNCLQPISDPSILPN